MAALQQPWVTAAALTILTDASQLVTTLMMNSRDDHCNLTGDVYVYLMTLVLQHIHFMDANDLLV